jgi:16S rRNA (guanine527-N7)-methyltransferase
MTALAPFIVALQAACADLGLPDSEAHATRLADHFELVLTTNRQFNLTRVTDPREAAVKLYADSLAVIAWAEDTGAEVRRCLDVGTGAGFPAVPVAVYRPTWSVTAIDSTGKKTRFVQQCATQLGITNLRTEHARAGEWRPEQRFQLILYKAVGKLPLCVRASARLVARGGYVVVYKGPGLTRAELDDGQEEAERTGLQTWDTFDYTLRCGDEVLEHTLVVYRQV